MEFGRIATDSAEGAILAHGVRLDGTVFKKGRVLSADDIAHLRAGGIETVMAARLGAGDLAEDEAAALLAEATAGPGVRASAPFTGRANLYAAAAGIVRFDPRRLMQFNSVDDSITMATVPDFAHIEAGQMLATVKIIPFAAPRKAVERACAIAAEDTPLLRVAHFKARKAGLVLTRLDGMKESILDKTARVTAERIERLGSTLAREIRCAHKEDEIAAAVTALLDDGCTPVLVFGASAIGDPRDVVPAAIEAAGGEIDHFGMPVDPGNLLLLAHHGNTPVLGVPGCARSPKLNGFDWVLERLLAGEEVAPEYIIAMGAGGLLNEIVSRPQRREDSSARRAPVPRIAAIVLAAGQSRRMGRTNKLLAEIDGVPMVRRAVVAALESGAGPVVVVTGHESARVRAALEDLEVVFAGNPDYAAGLSTSLVRGLEALDDLCDGAVVMLGDMPAVRPAHIDQLIAAFDADEGRSICVPTSGGKRGNPVLWGRQYFDEMKTVVGDVGAKHLIGEYEDAVCEVATGDGAVLFDIDTPEALTAIAGESRT
ncbi:MAG TPA: molybdopterin-binding/glycosyltransferase family 2 protein [Alphaproteobacteria bacterium]|nr:molybdopterin-binding/glycosyltransferase family 2 protein [Alphaproteobacteria bacterium]